MAANQDKPHERISELKQKSKAGPVLLQNSFRPFFLAAGAWGALAVPFWVLGYMGRLTTSLGFDDLMWHQHEMLYGFAGAAVAGFILTAIPNWTGGLPVSGWRLGLLVGLWLIGRIGFLFNSALDPLAIATLDLPFLSLLVLMIARELVTGRNWRNLPVLALIGLFTAGNWLVHMENMGFGETAATGIYLSILILAVLVAVIGGRIVPSFTRNWLVRQGVENLPEPMGLYDKIALLALIVFAIAQIMAPGEPVSGYLALLAGALHAVRLVRWKGWVLLTEPLIWVLHLGYAWVPVALLMFGAASLTSVVPETAALHALTTGAFGTMILAVMTRATLGHSGRELRATAGTTLIFVLVTLAALARVGAPFTGADGLNLIILSGVAWTAAYGLFVVLYLPIFLKR